MGLLGMTIGAITTVVGAVKGDEKMVKKGIKRYAFGATTTLIGDVFGVSDVIGEAFVGNDTA